MREKLLLIDGYSIMYRAHFAYAGRAMLTAPDGTPTGAISGFFNMVCSVIDEIKPERVCVLFDVSGKTFRHEIYSEYKGTRKPMPEELRVQMPILKTLLDKMGIARYEKPRFEADDLIGTLSLEASNSGMDVYIYSGDHDDYQLIDEHVIQIMPGSGKNPRKFITLEVFAEDNKGITPKEFITVKALMGDNSDNIKGVESVGPKTALDLVAKYHTIDGIYEHLDEIKGKLKERLIGQKEFLQNNIVLCTIDRHVEFDQNLDDTVYSISTKASDDLYDELSRLGLKAVIKKLNISSNGTSDKTNNNATNSVDPIDMKRNEYSSVIREIVNNNWNRIDVTDNNSLAILLDIVRKNYETYKEESCIVASISFYEDLAIIVTDNNANYFTLDAKMLDLLIEGINSISKSLLLAAYDFKTNSKKLPRTPANLNSVFDTMIGAYVMNIVSGNNIQLNSVYERTMFDEWPVTSKDDSNKNVQMSIFDAIPTSEELERQAKEKIEARAKEAFVNLYVSKIQEMLVKRSSIETLIYKIEMPLVITLDIIERNGMHISREVIESLHSEFSARIKELEKEIYELTGEEFLISSPKQLSIVLFEKLGLKHGKKNKTGVYSTSVEVLLGLRGEHPVIDKILEYRQMAKLDSTYTMNLLAKADENSRIHTTFTQAMTNTGRLSSTEPNLQNIPVRTKEGSKIRSAFTAPEGRVLVDLDYSQIELRLLAHMSRDEAMISAFEEGEDIHKRTASRIYMVDESEVTSEMRAVAKTVNFSVIYGVTEYGLSQDLGISYGEAKDLIRSYGIQFPRITSFLNGLKQEGEASGVAKTLFGRERKLIELNSASHNMREFGLRVAMNTPIQGTAADIIKIAMNKVRIALANSLPDAKFVMQVHDELIIECKEEDAVVCEQICKEQMESAVKLYVPLVADGNIGKDWLEAK